MIYRRFKGGTSFKKQNKKFQSALINPLGRWTGNTFLGWPGRMRICSVWNRVTVLGGGDSRGEGGGGGEG